MPAKIDWDRTIRSGFRSGHLEYLAGLLPYSAEISCEAANSYNVTLIGLTRVEVEHLAELIKEIIA